MVFLPDQTAVAVPHSTDLLSGSHLIHRTGGLLGYRLVISNRGINSVSDRITTIINRSALPVPFNFPQMIETRYCEAAFMFCDLVCLAENRSAALLRRENFVMGVMPALAIPKLLTPLLVNAYEMHTYILCLVYFGGSVSRVITDQHGVL